jgi:hypothetical protein
MPVANHLSVAPIILHARVTLDALGDFVLDGLSQHLLGSLPQEVRQNISRLD